MNADLLRRIITSMKFIGWAFGGILAGVTLAQVQLKPSSYGPALLVAILVIFLLATYVPLFADIRARRTRRKRWVSDEDIFDYYGV